MELVTNIKESLPIDRDHITYLPRQHENSIGVEPHH